MSKLFLLFNTLKYLKVKQIVYQILYRLQKIKPLLSYRVENLESYIPLSFSDFLKSQTYVDALGNFTFLNQSVKFSSQIDWNFMDNGKLWNYNLHYCNYLLQEDLLIEKRLEWLKNLQNQLSYDANGLEPYPVSLRLINSIRFVNRHKIVDANLIRDIAAEANFLSKRLEFHLLGNHLLENLFALLLSGASFNRKDWVNKAQTLLRKELQEQILPDGGHFELSPMYHQIILYRVLELIDWYSKWEEKSEEELRFYVKVGRNMISWLKQLTFSNGDIPLFSDSATSITYSSQELFKYAELLGIENRELIKLSSSGYRKFSSQYYECIVDVGEISARYQPAHGHSDALSFILYVNGQPVFVERGTSTYQIGAQRLIERSTHAHNTLVYRQLNQSEVWGGFRVGNRANVKIHSELNSELIASHDGYVKYGGTHKRTFRFQQNEILIIDDFLSKKELNIDDCIVYFHFHPTMNIAISDNEVRIGGFIIMSFENAVDLKLDGYKFASQYNQYRDSNMLKVTMKAKLQTRIKFL